MKSMYQPTLNTVKNIALTTELGFDALVMGGCDYIPAEHKAEKVRFSGVRGRFRK